MEDLLWLGITGGASLFGYLQARKFVRERLRFVDGAQKPTAPLVAGVAAAVVAAPIVWLLPVVGAGSALLFGLSVGIGTRLGATDVRRLRGV